MFFGKCLNRDNPPYKKHPSKTPPLSGGQDRKIGRVEGGTVHRLNCGLCDSMIYRFWDLRDWMERRRAATRAAPTRGGAYGRGRERQEIRRNTLSIRRNTPAKTPQAKTLAPTGRGDREGLIPLSGI